MSIINNKWLDWRVRPGFTTPKCMITAIQELTLQHGCGQEKVEYDALDSILTIWSIGPVMYWCYVSTIFPFFFLVMEWIHGWCSWWGPLLCPGRNPNRWFMLSAVSRKMRRTFLGWRSIKDVCTCFVLYIYMGLLPEHLGSVVPHTSTWLPPHGCTIPLISLSLSLCSPVFFSCIYTGCGRTRNVHHHPKYAKKWKKESLLWILKSHTINTWSKSPVDFSWFGSVTTYRDK